MKTALLRNIEAKATGRRVAVPTSIESISFDMRETPAFDHARGVARECTIDVRLGATAYISEENLQHSPERAEVVIAQTKKQIGRMVAKHVYGDVQDKLFELATELHRQRGAYMEDTSIKLINELLDMTEY
jgi:hypothetical protein